MKSGSERKRRKGNYEGGENEKKNRKKEIKRGK